MEESTKPTTWEISTLPDDPELARILSERTNIDVEAQSSNGLYRVTWRIGYEYRKGYGYAKGTIYGSADKSELGIDEIATRLRKEVLKSMRIVREVDG